MEIDLAWTEVQNSELLKKLNNSSTGVWKQLLKKKMKLQSTTFMSAINPVVRKLAWNNKIVF